MKTSFRKTVEKFADQGDDVGGRLPCLFCQTPTQRATLSQYGARCFRCYEAYCQEPQAPARVSQLKQPSVLNRRQEADAEQRDQAKKEQARRVAEYAQRRGIALVSSPDTDSSRAHVLSPKRHSGDNL